MPPNLCLLRGLNLTAAAEQDLNEIRLIYEPAWSTVTEGDGIVQF